MFIRTLTGKTEKERGKMMEVAKTSIATSYSHAEGRIFTVSFSGPEEEGLFRDPSVNVTMNLEEAEKHLKRFGDMVAHAKLPEITVGSLRKKTDPTRPLNFPEEGLEVFHATNPNMTGTLRLTLSGFLLMDSNGTALAKIGH